MAHLFFYGVLREGLGDWPFLDGIGPGRPAKAHGRLFAIGTPQGWYPALLPGEGIVHGACHSAGGADLAAMDAFEGADYERRPIAVDVGGLAHRADAYLWTSELPEGAGPTVSNNPSSGSPDQKA